MIPRRSAAAIAALALALALSFLSAARGQAESVAASETVPGSNSTGNRLFKKIELPVEPSSDHASAARVDLEPLRQFTLLPLSSIRPIRLEASYNEPLTLKDALKIAVQKSLPIKIASETVRYQKYQLLASLAGFLPSFSTGWGYTHVSVQPVPTRANSRVFGATMRFPVFMGGAIVYPALAQYYRLESYHHACRATVNDSLLDVYKQYTNLVLNNALLNIRVKSYQFSQAQLQLNNALYVSGTGTQFAIMQSRAQLAADEQELLKQQALTRQASMAVSYALDLPMSVNFLPVEQTVAESELLNERLEISHLLAATQKHRPELKQYENLRLAAGRNVQIASTSLYPSLSFFTTFTHASTTVYPAENTEQLSGVASAQVAGNTGVGTVSATALNQTASFSPSGNNQGTSGANTSASVVASSGGNPIASTQSGGLVTSGAVGSGFVSNSTGSGGSSNTAGAGVFPGLSSTFRMGLSLSWNLSSLGQTNLSSIMAARNLARQSLLMSNQELLLVANQVRTAYCTKIANRDQIDSASYAVKSAGESLRLANLRLRAGLGTNLELIQAQRAYVAALTAQVQAIVASNQAQAQLLHDTGLISCETLTEGYKGTELPKTR
jgi:outer membrane protein TolC